MKILTAKAIRAIGIILFNLFFAWGAIFLMKVFIVSGLFADDIMQIDLSKSELTKLKFIKDVMVDSSSESMWIFSAVWFCFASGALVCYRQMKKYLMIGDNIDDAQKFMRQNGTASVWWFSAFSSAILIVLPPFTSFDKEMLHEEREANIRLYNSIEKENEHIAFMLKTGKINELKEEYPKFLDGQEFHLTLDQTTLTSFNLSNPITLVPFIDSISSRISGISSEEKLEDIMFFPKRETEGKEIAIEADLSKESDKSMVSLGFSLRAAESTCMALEVNNEVSGREVGLLLSHEDRRLCVGKGELEEVSINMHSAALPDKVKISFHLDTPADVEISDAAITVAKNYKERYFDSSFCIEGKALAYPKNIRSYIYIPSFSSLDSSEDWKHYSSLTCQQAIMGKRFNYPYSP